LLTSISSTEFASPVPLSPREGLQDDIAAGRAERDDRQSICVSVLDIHNNNFCSSSQKGVMICRSEFEKEVWKRAEHTVARRLVSLASLGDIAALKTHWKQHMPTLIEQVSDIA
jgi:hypothetical protein